MVYSWFQTAYAPWALVQCSGWKCNSQTHLIIQLLTLWLYSSNFFHLESSIEILLNLQSPSPILSPMKHSGALYWKLISRVFGLPFVHPWPTPSPSPCSVYVKAALYELYQWPSMPLGFQPGIEMSGTCRTWKETGGEVWVREVVRALIFQLHLYSIMVGGRLPT